MSTIDTSTPMELLGANPGISVIDTSSVLTRLWYFDGKFLRAEGFRRDQQYVRSLVALSNQAVGHGVVHGFDVRRGASASTTTKGSDVLTVSAGLALAPSGRVIHLPGEVELDVAKLIARSFGELDPGIAATPGTADFSPCPPETPGDPITTVAARPVYVLTVAATEALCGDEETFGQLCEDACATETNRSTAVEGARFLVRELHLNLPVSTKVPFDDTHLRSRIASAYFERERAAAASMISGAGLRSSVWCRGADGVGGEEVPLAVFGRTGSGGLWLDTWTARRELVEGNPQRYWGWRLAMRPPDVFLAQVLQFQCQLVEAPATGGGGGGAEDPCADERSALAEADQVLGTLLAVKDTGSGSPTDDASVVEGRITPLASFASFASEGSAGTTAMKGLVERLTELRTKISGALASPTRPASGSLLIDWGHVTIPSGGYLPVDRTRDLEAQVRALMGPGVDLRFCAVRPDFVPEALQEAQHMERISLTRGIDDPNDLEEVDILVPGGTITEPTTAIDAFEGRIRLLPSVRRDDDGTTTGSVLTLAAVARDQVQDGWSWTLAAHGEAPQRLAVGSFVGAVFARSASPTADVAHAAEAPADAEAPAAERGDAAFFVETDATFGDTLAAAAFRQRLNREAAFARERYERAARAVFTEDVAAEADRPVPRDEKRPFSLWFDVETDRDLREVATGGRASARLRLTLYSRAATEPAVVDAQLTGSLVVRSSQTSTVGGARVVEIVTDVEGAMDRLVIAGGQVDDPPPEAVRGLVLRWRIAVTPAGVRILDVGAEQSARGLRATFRDEGSPRQIRGSLTVRTSPITSDDLAAGWSLAASAQPAEGRSVELAALELDESPGALDVGAQGRDLAEAVISVIGTQLAVSGRDDGFATVARRRMFETGGGGASTVTPNADWVMFHRRRTKACAGVTQRPVALRRFRWFHVVLDSRGELAEFAALFGRWQKASRARSDIDALRAKERVDQLGFERVADVEFPEGGTELASSRLGLRAAWGAQDRGASIAAGLVASPATGDGVHVDRGRFGSATSAISDLVDISAMETRSIAEIPPEFQSPGLDGAFFTVAYERPQLRRMSALVVRTPEGVDFIVRRGLQELNRDVIRDIFGGELDAVVAEWDGTTFANPDEVLGWWGTAQQVKQASYVPAEVAASGEEAVQLESCMDSLAGTLGTSRIQIFDEARWVDDDTAAVVLVLPS